MRKSANPPPLGWISSVVVLGLLGLGLIRFSSAPSTETDPVHEQGPIAAVAVPGHPENAATTSENDFGPLPAAHHQSSSAVFHALAPAPKQHALRASLALRELSTDGEHTFAAPNPLHHFEARFHSHGAVEFTPFEGPVIWSGTMHHSRAAAAPRKVHDHKIEIVHASGVREWYENSSRGLEHGFVIPEEAAPGLRLDEEQVGIPVGLDGLVAEADPASSGDLRFTTEAGTPVLGYRGLKVWDASGATLEAEMHPTNEGFLLAVNDTSAAYPITIDPFIVSFDSDTSMGEHIDAAVKGNLLATGFNSSVDDVGDVRIYQIGSDGLLTQEYFDDFTGMDVYGMDVDGDTAVAAFVPSQNNGTREVEVYRRFENIGVSWITEQTLPLTSDSPSPRVALDGDTLMVEEGTQTTIWTRQLTTWSVQDTIAAGGPIALEGNTAVIGNQVHVRTGSSWTLQQTLSEVPNPEQIALSGDTIILDTTAFFRDGTTWTSQGSFPTSPGPIGLEGDRAIFLSIVPEVGLVVSPFERSGTVWNPMTPCAIPRYCSIANRCYSPRGPFKAFIEGDRLAVTGFWNDEFATWRGVTFLTLADAGFAAPAIEVDEGAGTAEVVVELSEPAATQITIDYATVSGGAESGADFTAQSGTLTIPQDEMSGTIQVPIIDDNWNEGAESFLLTLSNATGIDLPAPIQTTVTITDNDPLVIDLLDASATEGEQLEASVELSNPSVFPVEFRLWHYDNTAVKFGTVDPGETSLTLDLGLIEQDALVEGTQTFSMELRDVEVATVGDGTGVITILDDDLTSLFIADLTVNESDGVISVPIEIPQILANPVEFTYELIPGSAQADLDYVDIGGTVILPSAALSIPILVPILDDFLVEGEESFTITATSVMSGESATATITITDGGPGFDGWAIDQGFGDTPMGPDDDLNNDGFDNLLHQGLAMPLDAFLPAVRPSLLPRIDLEIVPGRVACFVEFPDTPVAGIILGVEESADGQTWTELASRLENGAWINQPGTFLILGGMADGYQSIGVVTDLRDTSLFRITARHAE